MFKAASARRIGKATNFSARWRSFQNIHRAAAYHNGLAVSAAAGCGGSDEEGIVAKNGLRREIGSSSVVGSEASEVSRGMGTRIVAGFD